MIFANKLSEDTKWLIVAFFLIFIVVFALIGFIGILIRKLMHHQGNKMESMVTDVVNEHVITNGKKLRIFGIKKNHRQLFKEAWIPVLIMVVSSLIFTIYCLVLEGQVHFFDYTPGSRGFRTLFFVWDWKNPSIRGDFFFFKNVILQWPPALNVPHWDWNAWGSYLFFFGMIVGGLWFLYCVQAYIARSYRLFKLSRKIFEKNLNNFDPNSVPAEEEKPEQ